jgi:hypothetical protein
MGCSKSASRSGFPRNQDELAVQAQIVLLLSPQLQYDTHIRFCRLCHEYF